MMNMNSCRTARRHYVPVVLSALLVVLLAGFAYGAVPATDQARLHQEIADGLDSHSGLDGVQRERMMDNLQQCLDQGMTAEQVHALFPQHAGGGPGHTASMLAVQDRVLALAGADLPLDLVMDKIMEGRMKNVPDERLDRVVAEMGHGIEVSHRIMKGAVDGGVVGPATRAGMHGANSDLARCLWDGLEEPDMEHLAQRALARARDGGCSLDDFVAASQTAAHFANSGMEREQAVAMAGDAIQHGYSGAEMRSMGDMVAGTADLAGNHHEMTAQMQAWVREGMSLDDMTRHMMDGGWMGPADMMGPGGHHPMDNMGWGGPGHDGGMGDADHGHGGMGGDGGQDGGHDGGGMGGH